MKSFLTIPILLLASLGVHSTGTTEGHDRTLLDRPVGSDGYRLVVLKGREHEGPLPSALSDGSGSTRQVDKSGWCELRMEIWDAGGSTRTTLATRLRKTHRGVVTDRDTVVLDWVFDSRGAVVLLTEGGRLRLWVVDGSGAASAVWEVPQSWTNAAALLPLEPGRLTSKITRTPAGSAILTVTEVGSGKTTTFAEPERARPWLKVVE